MSVYQLNFFQNHTENCLIIFISGFHTDNIIENFDLLIVGKMENYHQRSIIRKADMQLDLITDVTHSNNESLTDSNISYTI